MNNVSLWTVYDHPSDFPRFFVARRWEITQSGSHPTNDVILANTLEDVRILLAGQGCVRLGRAPADDLTIVETWL